MEKIFVTDEDIANEAKYYDKEKSYDLAKEFNLLSKVLVYRVLEPKCGDSFKYLGRIKTIIQLASEHAHYEMISRSKNKMILYCDQISSRNKEKFNSIDFNKFVKNDEKKDFLMSLIEVVKSCINSNTLTSKEEAFIWDTVSSMLEKCISFEEIILQNKMRMNNK